MTQQDTRPDVAIVDLREPHRFGGLVIDAGNNGVIRPRPWTVAQAEWAADLMVARPRGPVLELFAGAGHIGLELVRRTGRRLVQVDASFEACRWARHNAAQNGLADCVSVRNAPVTRALTRRETFQLILADPPYVPSAEVNRYPDDPRVAIDGGTDGLDLVRQTLELAHRHAAWGAPLVLQVRGPRQALAVRNLLRASPELPLGIEQIRAFGVDRALVLLRALPTRARFATPATPQPATQGAPP